MSLDAPPTADDRHSRFQQREARIAILVMACVSVLLLLLTYAVRRAPGSLPLHWQWHLGWENNFAAWWSGALLALAAAWTADGKCRSSLDEPRVGKAWLGIALIMLFLSADEIGSLHERLGLYGPRIGMGEWGLPLILGAVLGAAFIWSALAIMRSDRTDKAQLLVICLGFALLVSVAGQEYLEHNVAWEGSAFAPFRTVVEEGTELAGMLVLLFAATLRPTPFAQGPFATLARYRRPALLGAMVVAPLLLLISRDGLPDKGRPLDWISSILFLGTAALALRTSILHDSGWRFISVAALMTLSAVAVVAIPPHLNFDLGLMAVHQRAAVAALALCATLLLVPTRLGSRAIMLLAALSFLAMPSGYTTGLVGSFLVGFASFGCMASATQWTNAPAVSAAAPPAPA